MSSRVAGSPTKQCSPSRDVKTTQILLAGSFHSAHTQRSGITSSGLPRFRPTSRFYDHVSVLERDWYRASKFVTVRSAILGFGTASHAALGENEPSCGAVVGGCLATSFRRQALVHRIPVARCRRNRAWQRKRGTATYRRLDNSVQQPSIRISFAESGSRRRTKVACTMYATCGHRSTPAQSFD